jgi:AraC-like DNA-binding protein
MMSRPLHRGVVPETFVQLLYEYLEQRGMSPEAVLGDPWPVPQAHGLGGVAIERWARLLERASGHLGDPLLGLHVGQTITPRHLGVLGYVLVACSNLGAALQRLERYQRLIFDVTPLEIRGGSGYIELVWSAEHGRHGQLVDDTGVAALVQFCRGMVRTQQPPLEVQFVNSEPDDTQPYRDFFACPVRFGRAETIVRVSLATLALPLKTADPGLIAVMERQADELLGQLPCEDAVVELARKATARLLHEGEPDIEAVAAGMQCAPRTLQRRLKAAGTGFRQELALVRRQLAEQYLRDPRLSIAEIAQLLGYSEHSAFSRSYREWTGVTPQRWRQTH